VRIGHSFSLRCQPAPPRESGYYRYVAELEEFGRG
jgi:hypothetical protein